MVQTSLLNLSQNILRAYNKLCEPILAEFDIPQVSFDILMFIANNPEFKTAAEISEIRHIKKNLVSVHVEKLVSAGLLTRSSFDGDRRKVILCHTEAAMPIIKRGRKMQSDFRNTLTLGISPEEWEAFAKMHEKIEKNVIEIINNSNDGNNG